MIIRKTFHDEPFAAGETRQSRIKKRAMSPDMRLFVCFPENMFGYLD